MLTRFVAIWARISCILFIGAAVTADAQTHAPLMLSDLATRYDAWRGGAAFEALKSLHISMVTQGSDGQTWNMDERASADGKYRFDLALQSARLTAVTTPFTTWRACRNCQFPASDAMIRSGALVRSLDFAGALTPSATREVELKGIEHWNGGSWAVVHLGGEQGVDVFIKPRTGRLGGVRRVEGGKPIVTRYADWRWVNGVRFAYTLKQEDGAATSTAIHIKSIEFDCCEDALLYARPADIRAAVFTAGQNSTGWLELKIDPARGLLLPVELNGKPVLALLDSGASGSAISLDDLPGLGLKAGGYLYNRGASTEIVAQTVRGAEIRIGDLTLRDPAIVAQAAKSMSAIRSATSALPVLILGGDAFNGLIVDLDLPNKRVAFQDAMSTQPPQGAIELPLIQNGQLRTVPVAIEGSEPAQFSVDTGYNGALQISPAFARAHNLPGSRAASAAGVYEIGGYASEPITTLHRLEIGGVMLRDAPVELPPGWRIGDGIGGMLGLAVLQRFRVILDFSHDKLWLVPSTQQVGAPFWREHLGIVAAQDDVGVRIMHIYPNSPAASAGLRPGDMIVRINGDPANSSNLSAAANSPTGTHVRIALDDGVEHDIALADFY